MDSSLFTFGSIRVSDLSKGWKNWLVLERFSFEVARGVARGLDSTGSQRRGDNNASLAYSKLNK